MNTTQLHNNINDVKERLMQQLPSSDEIMKKFEARIPMTSEEMQQEIDRMYDFDYMLTIIAEMGRMVDDGLITTPEQIEKIYKELSAQRSIYDLVVDLHTEFYTDGIHGIREIIQLIMAITDKEKESIMNTKKYFLTITYTNGTKEMHRSSSEDYIKRLIRGMFDQSGSMYQKYWRARIDCNVPGYDM